MIALFGLVTYDDDELPSKEEANRIFAVKVFLTVAKTAFAIAGLLLADKLGLVSIGVFDAVLIIILLVNVFSQVRNLFWGWELQNKLKARENEEAEA